MILQDCLDDVSAAISAVFVNGQVGTGTTEPTVADTALETPVAGTNQALEENNIDGNAISTLYSLGVSVGNGNDISEYVIDDGSNSKMRIVFSPVTKTSAISLDVIYGISLSQENL